MLPDRAVCHCSHSIHKHNRRWSFKVNGKRKLEIGCDKCECKLIQPKNKPFQDEKLKLVEMYYS